MRRSALTARLARMRDSQVRVRVGDHQVEIVDVDYDPDRDHIVIGLDPMATATGANMTPGHQHQYGRERSE
ncbi:hypothetical protein ACN27F_10300 [Solwaraspora sp. WMMB335]|uniref:hypothetical protein n=1 Tax=Solwaraspora sp. WMMB335 TaxID=3404118 RepID=UPI003B93D957